MDLSYDWGLGPLDSDTSECPELVAEVYLETRPYPPAVTLVPGASIPCWTLGVVVDAPLAPLVTRVTGARCDARPGLGGTLCSFPGSNPLSEADYAFYCDVSALFPSAAWRCVIYLE